MSESIKVLTNKIRLYHCVRRVDLFNLFSCQENAQVKIRVCMLSIKHQCLDYEIYLDKDLTYRNKSGIQKESKNVSSTDPFELK